ncbi:translation initiation factor EIF-2B gamma subunit, putative [Plasmodium ovale curtisi]|uniref:Translation initiation factor eIF2B subunit gamma n=1 Tax=Plasmodium ovale curtisi TaxID=864141 RepID=A0A1A8VZU9_PLAOA|nr:translation initiation factor EIF-2B gamma subunit, putative [Plasmodium ovale curtisi]SBS96504.1 translation initiation factor EIF-2B gamma subunit, putative [Plasmodium ovale curtisi]
MSSANQSRVPMGTFVEFQVVILTNDENHFASELIDNKCKGLIKISNRCMIYYIIKNIIEQRLKYITIVVNSKYLDDMVNYINETFPDNYKFDEKKNQNSYCIDVEPFTANGNEEMGSIQCLLQIKNKIKSDFIVVNCDILGFVDFHSLANLFRGENAICAIMLLEDSPSNSDKKKKEIKEEYLNLENSVWVCIDKNSKVVSIKDSLSMKQNGKLKISKINLLFHRNFILKTDLLDSHVYIFKNYVLGIMEHKKSFSSIKYDLIPYLVNIQNTQRAAEYYSKSEFKFNMYKTLINKYEEGEDHTGEGKKEVDSCGAFDSEENVESVVCYVQPRVNGFCQRINSVPNFIKANLLVLIILQTNYFSSPFNHDLGSVPILPRCLGDPQESIRMHTGRVTHFYKDCIISSHFEHDENIHLKKSVLGKNVTIRKNSTISRSICMDNITINENCHIQNTIICDNVVIEDNCKLIDCIIRENSVIEKNSCFEKETLPLFIS